MLPKAGSKESECFNNKLRNTFYCVVFLTIVYKKLLPVSNRIFNKDGFNADQEQGDIKRDDVECQGIGFYILS